MPHADDLAPLLTFPCTFRDGRGGKWWRIDADLDLDGPFDDEADATQACSAPQQSLPLEAP